MTKLTRDATTQEVSVRLSGLLCEGIGIFFSDSLNEDQLLVSRLVGIRLCEIVEEYLEARVPPRKNFKITGLRDADVVTNQHVPKGTAIIGPKLSGTLKDGVLHLDPIEISLYGVVKNIGDET